MPCVLSLHEPIKPNTGRKHGCNVWFTLCAIFKKNQTIYMVNRMRVGGGLQLKRSDESRETGPLLVLQPDDQSNESAVVPQELCALLTTTGNGN